MENPPQKTSTEPFFTFSTVTFRVQNAHLLAPPHPLTAAFANDTNIWLWSVLSLTQPSPANNFLWSKFKHNLLMLLSICHRMCQPNLFQLGWGGKRQKVTFYIQCVLQEARKKKRRTEFSSTWQESNAFSLLPLHFIPRLQHISVSLIADGEWKSLLSHWRARRVKAHSSPKGCNVFHQPLDPDSISAPKATISTAVIFGWYSHGALRSCGFMALPQLKSHRAAWTSSSRGRCKQDDFKCSFALTRG